MIEGACLWKMLAPAQWSLSALADLSFCLFREDEDKIVTEELEIDYDET